MLKVSFAVTEEIRHAATMNFSVFSTLLLLLVPATAAPLAWWHPLPETEWREVHAEQLAEEKKWSTAILTGDLKDATSVHSQRGDAAMFLRKWKMAEVDYERMIQIDPRLDVPHWRLGIAYYMLDKFDKGAQQFAKYHAYDDRDRENGVWHYFCVQKARGTAAAQKELLAYDQFDRHPFPDVYEMLGGKLTPQALQQRQDARHAAAAAEGGGRREQQQFFADLYLGMQAVHNGDKTAGLEHLAKATANTWGRQESGRTYMWQTARVLWEEWSGWHESGLVRVAAVAPTVVPLLRYATSNNITKAAFYPPDLPPLLDRETADKLAKAANSPILKARGLRIMLWDGYRPPQAQMHLWHTVRKSGFVAEPKKGSRWSWHCYGRAVDVTLCDAAGLPVAMPSDFDDFTAKAKADYTGSDEAVRENLALLRKVMLAAGFQPLTAEWWHFSLPLEPAPAEPVWWGKEVVLKE